jgi:hypothetical protein
MLKEWGFHKNVSSKSWKDVGADLRRRHLKPSEVKVYARGSAVPLKRLKKELQRYTTQGYQACNGIDRSTLC